MNRVQWQRVCSRCRCGLLEGGTIKRRRALVWMVASLTLASLPLCCLPTLAGAPNPLFRGEYTIANDSGEILYVTPVGYAHGRRWILAKTWSRFPYVPLPKQADIRLKPGESIHIVCTIDEDDAFSEIIVRNSRGEYRQLQVGQPTLRLMPQVGASGGAGPTYTISRFTTLDAVSPDVLKIARQARRPSTMLLPVLISPILLVAWGLLLWGVRRERRY